MGGIKIDRPEERNLNQAYSSTYESFRTSYNNTPREETIDLNNDGEISKMEEEAYERKAKNRRAMAWVALIAIIISGFALMFFISEARLSKLSSILDLYWVSLGGIVGAYVGISTWMSKR